MTRRAVASFLSSLCLIAVVYAGILDRIGKAWEERDFEKTEKLILKSLERDTLNPGARYYYSLLFLDSAFERRNIDSASYHIERSITDFEHATPEVLKDVMKSGLELYTLMAQKTQVADAAFARAQRLMVIQGFEDFLTRFAYSDKVPRAAALRDSLAFKEVEYENTWHTYEQYINAYPQSEYVQEARKRYQRLIFKDYTKDDRLESYVRFLNQHPDTPYRSLAESIIFERSTKKNTADQYLSFVRQYPNSYLRKKACDLLYYVLIEEHISQQVHLWHPHVDSLEALDQLNKETLFPVFEKSKFGFMNTEGTEVLSPEYDQVDQEYLCGGITDNWLQVAAGGISRLISRKGDELVGNVIAHKRISTSIKLVDQGNNYLYHASGFKILDLDVEDAYQLTNGWISFKHNYSWGIVSPSGSRILPPKYDAIDQVGPFIILESDQKFAITTVDSLVNKDTEGFSFIYDDYELIQDTLLQVFAGEREAILNWDLSFSVAPAFHEIYINGSFWYVKSPGGYRMVNEQESGVMNQVFGAIEVNDGWLAFKKPEEWLLISRTAIKPIVINALDSIKLLSDHFAYAKQGDEHFIVGQNGQKLKYNSTEGVKTLISDPKNGHASYVVVQSSIGSKENRKVYDQNLSELINIACDEVTLLTDSLFKVKCGGKVGMYSALTQQETLSPKYEALDVQDGLAFLLRNGKIGCFDLDLEVLIPAEYTARIGRIGSNYQVSKNGLYGLVDRTNKPLFPAEYDEIKAWNDTSIWARTDALWQLISLKGDVFIDKVQTLNMWIKINDQQLALVRNADGTGLYSNRNGELLPTQYNEIINVGGVVEPIFFAEQHLKTASFFVVTYFNLKKENLKSQAFRPEEYDQIYCDQ